jgi:hypothetical protein
LRDQESEQVMVRRKMEANAAPLSKLQRELEESEGPLSEMAMVRELEPRATDPRSTSEPAAISQIARATRAVEAAVSEQAAAVGSQDGPKVAKLIARASVLLEQGNISAARIALESAAETGSALAICTLA